MQFNQCIIDSFHIVRAHAANSLVPRYLHKITFEGETFIRLPMHNKMVYEKGCEKKINSQINIRLTVKK